jgi:hypothetical protein
LNPPLSPSVSQVAHMLYGFLIQTKNPWFEAIVSPEDLPALSELDRLNKNTAIVF